MLAENVGGAGDDLTDFWLLVVFEAVDDAEAIAEWSSESASSGGSADDSEVREVETDASGGRTFADDDVELVVFHGGVEDFFDDAAETVDFVNE